MNKYYPVTRYPTTIPGLRWRPSIEPEYSDDVDHYEPFHSLVTDHTTPDQYYSTRNGDILRHAMMLTGVFSESPDSLSRKRCILEIGLAIVTETRPFENTSTYALTQYKHPSVTYLGVDIAEKPELDGYRSESIHFLRCNSANEYRVINALDDLGCRLIDLLHIDGCHSVKMMLNDWEYSDLLAPTGVIVIHDIKVHPGPSVVLDAIDRAVWQVDAFFTDMPGDFGIATVRRQHDAVRS